MQLERQSKVWLAVQTHIRKEKVAIVNLHRQEFVTYCPYVIKTQRRKGRPDCAARVPLFPSYVFVALDLDGQRWRPLLSTFGVRAVVRVGERPGIVPAGFIDALQARETDGVVTAWRDPLHCGQQVQLRSGALEGLVGTIVEMDEKDRIVVLMQMLNQHVRVKVDRRQLAALPTP